MTTARGLLRSGSAATFAQAVRTLSLLVTHIVVRRFVPPEQLGIWAYLEPLFLVLATLRDLGVPTHVLRIPGRPLGTLLRLQTTWGGALGLALVLGAPLIAQASYDPGPALVAGIRVMVLYLFLEGFSSVALAWFESTLRIERSLPAELLRTFTYCGIVLVASVRGLGFWSFVVAQVVAQAVYAAELWRRARRDGIELSHEPGSTPRIALESLPVGTVWLLAIAVQWVDFFVVGGLYPKEALGLYSLGYNYAFLVTRILQQPIGRSLYPYLIAAREKPIEQFRAFRLATVIFLSLEVPAALFLAANAGLSVWILGGDRYQGAMPFLALLAFAPIVDPLGRFGGELLLARRLDGARNLSLGLQLVGLIAGGVGLSLWLGSPIGMAWANFFPFGSLVVLVVLLRGADRGFVGRLARHLAEVYLVPIVPFALAWWATPGRPWVRFAATAVAGLVSVGYVAWRHGAEFREFFSGREESPPDAPHEPPLEAVS